MYQVLAGSTRVKGNIDNEPLLEEVFVTVNLRNMKNDIS